MGLKLGNKSQKRDHKDEGEKERKRQNENLSKIAQKYPEYNPEFFQSMILIAIPCGWVQSGP